MKNFLKYFSVCLAAIIITSLLQPAKAGSLYLTAASDSEMEIGSSEQVAVTPIRQHRHKSAAKGWVRFAGTGVTTDLTGVHCYYNVTSVVDNATGTYTINWDTNFSDDTEQCSVASSNAYHTATVSYQPGYCQVYCSDQTNAAVDPDFVSVISFGDQD